MIEERTQLRTLYRDFLFRIVDLEILTSGGEVQNLLVQFAAVLGAFSFVMVVLVIPRYANSRLPIEALLWGALGDQEFLIGSTIALVGLFSVLAWNALLPDRRDSLVLGPLPIRLRTIFLAKTAAIATALGGCVFCTNAFTGFAYPVLIRQNNVLIDVMRGWAAYWVTSAAAGLFIFAALLAAQGVIAQLLSYRLFLRVSSFLQMAAFFAILAMYFLRPSLASPGKLADPANRQILLWLPSYWFLALFQELNGPVAPVFRPLATRAVTSLAVALAIAAVTYALAWFRNIRKIIEQPNIAPGDRGHAAAPLGRYLAAKICPEPFAQAILRFCQRKIPPSRPPQLHPPPYGGTGLAAALVYVKNYLSGSALRYSRHAYVPTSIHELNQPFLAAGLILLLCALIGYRAVFALPISLSSNWIFRMTNVHHASVYCAAVRRTMYALAAAPIGIVLAAIYLALWPAVPALGHLAILAAAGAIQVERSLYGFRKIPFTCSYLPGGGNLHMKVAVFGVIFLLFIEAGTFLEYRLLQGARGWAIVFAILAGIALWLRHRTTELAEMRENRLLFEDLPDAVVSALDPRQDGEWSSDQAYVNAIEG